MAEFQQDTNETPVIFRRDNDGDIIALFPTEPGDMNGATCSCYQHIGQHSSADPYFVIRQTMPASPDQYAELKQELESAPYGYRLRVYRRWHHRWDDIRWVNLTQITEKAVS